MKLPAIVITALAAAFLTPAVFADDQPAGCKCEMMKKHPAPATETPLSEAQIRQAELDKLVSEMNGNVGQKKIEAMAAIITRLAEQSKAKAAAPAASAPAANDGAKHEGHEH